MKFFILMSILIIACYSFFIQNSDGSTEVAENDSDVITQVSTTTEIPGIDRVLTQAKPPLPEYWLVKTGIISDELIKVQAVVVKDEDTTTPCHKGKRKSKQRYLMCAGSILNRNHILTSASCLHEALHIRHNIRAPLAVAVAPLKSTVQIIRVAEYRIHPQHTTNPYSLDYAKHNIAIVRLACKIDAENYHKIELPDKPMMDLCSDENCIVPIYKIVGYTSTVLSQICAPNLASVYRKRRKSNDNYRIKKSTDGSHLCAETGSAVMINNTQTAIVAVSCDDRQPLTKWRYTDLFENQNWIHDALHHWNITTGGSITGSLTDPISVNSSDGITSKSCGNCIFNFYISVGCKGKEKCQNKSGTNVNIDRRAMRFQNHNSLKKQKIKTALPSLRNRFSSLANSTDYFFNHQNYFKIRKIKNNTFTKRHPQKNASTANSEILNDTIYALSGAT